ncbi:MAG TPA: ankyrin repeat domain-containing protein [Verrucomicrobiae bacterium]|nr:ankyrin repeat domain-containing protein [Verrucomicrobiae bacterium]
MHAAFYLDGPWVARFLKNGANPNVTNKTGATPLMWAVSDVEKVRVLLKHGAKPNAVSEAGNTPLIIAAHQYGSAVILKELIGHRADVRAASGSGENPLRAAARAGDVEALRVLLAHGAEVNAASRTAYSASAEASAVMIAAQFGHRDCVELLLEKGADVHFTSDFGNALHFAALTDRKDIGRLLIERGANVNAIGKRIVSFRNDPGFTPLMYAAMTERNDPVLVQLLIDRGADVNARTPAGETAFSLARLRGETKIVAALRAAGAEPNTREAEPRKTSSFWSREQIGKPDPAVLRKSVEAGLALLSDSGAKFTEATANRCFSCHQQSQPALALGLAKQNHFSFDETAAADQLSATLRAAHRRKGGAIEEPLPVPSIAAWFLIGLHAAGHPGNALTDAYAYSLARTQTREGRWATKAARAPMDYSDVTSTALSIRSLQLYAPPTLKKSFDQRIAKGARWLSGYDPDSTEERAFQILGLHWARSGTSRLTALTEALLRQQRDDGGWAQLPTLPSDGYATGLVLYALNQGAGLSPSHPAYQRGARFLLKEQLSDGSWFVQTRASPVQVAIDDIFAHGRHQWISSAATSWSTMALMLAEQRTQ